MIEWNEFLRVTNSRSARRKYLFKNEQPFHVLFSQQFQREDLDKLYQTATAIRKLHKRKTDASWLRKTLQGKRLLCLFVQPSTRTVESFVAAGEKLGMDARVIQDISTSSFAKGETVEDSIRTLSSYFDVVVTRNKEEDFALKAAYATLNSKRSIPVISGGSGSSHHVTQSLLDIYTLQYSFAGKGGVDGKHIMFVCDLLRNRAARSLIYLLTKFNGIKLTLVTPPSMQLDAELREYITINHDLEVNEFTSVEEALKLSGKTVNAIYMTRNQKEYGRAEDVNWNEADFWLKWDYRRYIDENCVIMHPLPRQEELPIEWDEFPGSVVWRQVRNGMWIRAALFANIFGVDQEIRDNAASLGIL